jgi:PAS domain S-box-containing protein
MGKNSNTGEYRGLVLENIFNISPDAVILHNASGRILDANTQAIKWLGYTRDELTSLSVADIETTYSDAELRSLWAELDLDDRRVTEGRHRKKDGTEFPVEISIRKTVAQDEEVFIILSRDISEQKQREAELERYERLVENLPIGIYQNTPGPDGNFTFLNEAMVDIFDAESRDDLREHPVSSLYQDQSDRKELSDKLLDEGVVREEELQLETLSGDEIWGSVTAVVQTDTDEGPVFDGAIQDVTERKFSQRRLKEQRDNLEILNQVVRHDIRNDLQLVTAYADLIADEVADDTEMQGYVDTLQNSARDAIELTTTARDLAAVMLAEESDNQPRHLQNTLEEVLESIRSDYPEAIIAVDGSIPDVRVRANALLESVFRNLLQNAVQHNNADVPEVRVSAASSDDTARVQIADNGPGIPDGQKESIFGKGEKGLDSPGTGIGLYLVESLVDSYGGDVWVSDNEPAGTIFTVTLPEIHSVTRSE